MSIAELKEAIQALTEQERCELHVWLQNWPSDDWDRQMEKDAASGKLARLAMESSEAYGRGECTSFP